MRSRHRAAAARPPVGGRGRLPGQLGVPRLAAYDARVPRRTALQSFSSDLRRSYWDFSGFLASQGQGAAYSSARPPRYGWSTSGTRTFWSAVWQFSMTAASSRGVAIAVLFSV